MPLAAPLTKPRQAATSSLTTEANKPVDETGGDPIGWISDYHERLIICPTQIAIIGQMTAPHKVSGAFLSATIKMGGMVAKEKFESSAGIFVDQDIKEWSASITAREEEKALATEIGGTATKHKVGTCVSRHDYKASISRLLMKAASST